MIESVRVRQALTEDDIVEVAAMWTRSAAWLRGKGLDQWQYPVKWENIRRTVTDGTCWLVTDHDGRPIGTITVEFKADPYWDLSDDPDNALYVHRMVVVSGARGGELGSALLDWAARRARRAGKSWLRLDAWKSNPALHQYYLDRGFTLVRIDDNPADPSGACFQRLATVELHVGPDVVEDNTPKSPELPASDGKRSDHR
ncbi:MAG: GNAT family N-acetyltransferase [Pseudonocardiales bacterium]|nr:GNAT family N-acetyltransferase [Pseudonocardiales bacterium]